MINIEFRIILSHTIIALFLILHNHICRSLYLFIYSIAAAVHHPRTSDKESRAASPWNPCWKLVSLAGYCAGVPVSVSLFLSHFMPGSLAVLLCLWEKKQQLVWLQNHVTFVLVHALAWLKSVFVCVCECVCMCVDICVCVCVCVRVCKNKMMLTSCMF